MITPGSTNPLLATADAGGYRIERSLRFNSADSAYLNRTPASAGNRKTWTWSGWVKRSALTGDQVLFYAGSDANNNNTIRFNSDNTIYVFRYESAITWGISTTPVYRDASAWYHVVVSFDTTQATSSNRVKLYINGSQVTTFTSTSYPNLNVDNDVNNTVLHRIGNNAGSNYLDGYLTEINFIDGSAKVPGDFGETDTDTGVWKPKAYSGSYGTNGFYLKFADNSGTTSTTLGKDSSGNSNNWTPNNFYVGPGTTNAEKAGIDSLVDTPNNYGTDTGVGGEVRGNYATLNPLDTTGLTFANGNLDVSINTTSWRSSKGTISMASGKWYFECTPLATFNHAQIGVSKTSAALPAAGGSGYLGVNADSWCYQSGGSILNNGIDTTSGISSAASGDIMMVAVDIDAGKLWFGKNGTWFNSGAPATGSNAAYTNLSGAMSPAAAVYNNASGLATNFGQRPFAYTAPSGFKALCTQNLPTPTIGATSTTQAGKYFNIITWSGTNGARTFTGVGFQPDFVWGKLRNGSGSHQLYDAVRGTGASKALASNATDAEGLGVGAGSPALYGYLSAFTSDGFSVADGTDPNPSLADAYWNDISNTYVAWNWKANGAGSSNTQGSITSTVSANTTAGFSIVTYTGNGTNNATVGHGLGVAPAMIILKNRDGAYGWLVLHTSVGLTGTTLDGSPEYYMLTLNTTDARTDFTNDNIWNPTSTTFKINGAGTGNYVNANGIKYVAYCFAPVAGYSAFGSYTGNGSTDGPFVYTGFRPKWILIKPSSIADSWQIEDAARSPFNVVNDQLFPSNSNAEQVDSATRNTDFLSNGFKIRGTNGGINQSSETYVYACFAENPFKYSLAR